MVTAKKRDGTLWNWGTPGGGEDAGLGAHSTPSQIGADTDWKLLSGSRYSFFATKTDNTRYAWGYNRFSELGRSTYYDNPVTNPTQIDTQAWKMFSGGGDAGIGIKTDGTMWLWGKGLFTGPGNYGRSSPCQIGSASTWVTVSGGNSHILAIKSNGTLWSGGDNQYGELGLNDTSRRDIGQSNGFIGELSQVGALTTWLQTMAGYHHSLAVKTDGTLWAWGNNSQGQLGLGDVTSRSSPTQVGNLTTWSILPTTATQTVRHSAAIKSDGTLWLWGMNNYGQLGDGTATDRSSPVQVGSNTSWTAIYLAYSITLATSG
jgi:alpha-tubulin suppressor-like RCC1 family protein